MNIFSEMNRRTFLKDAGFILAGASTLAKAGIERPNNQRKTLKNILFITTDQHRHEYLGITGKTPVKTPNIDNLAKSGAYHTKAYSVNPICMPARCSWLTGLYSHQHGLMNNRGDLNPYLDTMPKTLQRQGYKTALIGKEHFYEGHLDLTKARKYTNEYLGFDTMWSASGKSMVALGSKDDYTYYLKRKDLLQKYRQMANQKMANRKEGGFASPTLLNEEDTVDFVIKEKCLSFLKEHEDTQPFFLWLSFCGPHFPFDPPKKYFDKYNPKDMPKPVDSPSKKLGYYQSYMAAYCGMIEQIDGYIGQVVEQLREKGVLDDTLIVFTSDHGDMMGDHGYWAKMRPYEGSSHVPFIANNKDLIKSKVYEQATEITDVVATFLQVAGIDNVTDALPRSPSKSLLGLWQGNKIDRKYAFCETGDQFVKPYSMLTDGIWKYVYFKDDSSEVLYNIERDPAEVVNYASENPELMVEFRSELLKRISITPPPNPSEWVYQRIHNTSEPNPNRCSHGGTERK